jgi:site-specific recombinase
MPASSLKHILTAIASDAASASASADSKPSAEQLIQLVAAIRPPRLFAARRRKIAVKRVEELIALLRSDDDLRHSLRAYIIALLSNAHHTSLYTESGILPQSGFFSEGFQKIIHLILPPVYDETSLRGLVNRLFHENDDHLWLAGVSDDLLVDLLQALDFDGLGEGEQNDEQHDVVAHAEHYTTTHAYNQLLSAALTLSHKIAAMGLEPEITARLPEFDEFSSPFVAQHRDLASYVDFIRGNGSQAILHPLDSDSLLDDQALVMLRQCDDCIDYIRRRRDYFGASLALSYQMQRITQHTRRLRTLIRLMVKPDAHEPRVVAFRVVALWKEVVAAENTKHSLAKHIADLTGLLAFQVAENAARRGEHYITATREEYAALFRSALAGGAVVALLSLLKLLWYYRHFPPFGEAFCYGMTYSLGFIIIHIIGGTLATKQPAMTASAIANALDTKKTAQSQSSKHSAKQSSSHSSNHSSNHKHASSQSAKQVAKPDGKPDEKTGDKPDGKPDGKPEPRTSSRRNNDVSLQNLVVMIAQISRSQLVSFVGNVGMSFPTALAVSWALSAAGLVPADAHKAEKMIAELHPFTSGSLIYAGIAGVFLFVTGLLAGVYDNMVVHNRIGDRLRQHPLLRRVLAKHRLERFAGYIEHNLGAMAGNFFLGLLLGSAATVGFIVGLPIDIRHITFAAANIAVALVSLLWHGAAVAWEPVAWAAVGVVGIGVMNFLVSFSLALTVAMRSRRVSFRQTRELMRLLGKYFLRNGREFVLPPKPETAAETATDVV